MIIHNSHTPQPTPYTLHPTPYTLHPTPHPLHCVSLTKAGDILYPEKVYYADVKKPDFLLT
ncbi:hypothetical protein BFG60_0489 [Microcystis aeruginosa NIES-98]|nr:hypothetical protein BFG60_0489 [Microcystis aeruginosa NIES-98]